MKRLNKLLAIVLAIAMIMSMAVVVQADDPLTITVNTPTDSNSDGETYYAYKVFDASGFVGSYTYTISSNNYFYETIASLSDVFKEDGTTRIGTEPTTAYFTLTRIGDGTSSPVKYVVVANTAATENGSLAEAVVKALKEKADADTYPYNYAATATADNGSATLDITNFGIGYYFVTTTTGSAVAVGGTYPITATLTDKNETPTVDKTVYDTTGATYNTNSKSNNAQIGDIVYFQTKISNIEDATNLVLHDLMEAGLSLNSDSISATLYSATNLTGTLLTANGTDYTVDTTTNYYIIDKSDTTKYPFATDGTYYTKSGTTYTLFTDGTATGFDSDTDYYVRSTFDIDFVLTSTNLSSLDSTSYIIVSYSATLTGTGVEIYDSSNDNETYVSYGDSSYSTKSLTQTYTYKVSVFKYTGSNTPLANAKFRIYYTDSNGDTQYLTASDISSNYTVTGKTTTATEAAEFVSDASGNINISGLDADTTYYLEETEAPSGYNPLTAPIQFKINETDKTQVNYGNTTDAEKISVINNAGVDMPTTGGIGTTIFYIVGGVLVVGAIVLLITKKRIGKDGE
ncbi:MAG: LPXTG cell wall anchor domain-containing protein [Oscillospiraceae bacterium]|nr:LPXTG cell wall anchor domain-containing protein [Oscillospiraceae bacterium]